MSSPSKNTPKTLCVEYLGRLAAAGPLEAISQNTIIVIKNIQTTGASDAGWSHLAKCFAFLEYLFQEFKRIPNKKEGMERKYLDSVAKYLGALKNDLQRAWSGGESGLMEFFGNESRLGTVTVHNDTHSNLVDDFTTFVCSKTRFTEDDIHAKLSEISRDLKIRISANGGAGSYSLSNNYAGYNQGMAFANWSFTRGMDVSANDNRAERNVGDAFCNLRFN